MAISENKLLSLLKQASQGDDDSIEKLVAFAMPTIDLVISRGRAGRGGPGLMLQFIRCFDRFLQAESAPQLDACTHKELVTRAACSLLLLCQREDSPLPTHHHADVSTVTLSDLTVLQE